MGCAVKNAGKLSRYCSECSLSVDLILPRALWADSQARCRKGLEERASQVQYDGFVEGKRQGRDDGVVEQGAISCCRALQCPLRSGIRRVSVLKVAADGAVGDTELMCHLADNDSVAAGTEREAFSPLADDSPILVHRGSSMVSAVVEAVMRLVAE